MKNNHTNPMYANDSKDKGNDPTNDISMADLGYYNPVEQQDTLMVNPLHMDKYKTWYDILRTDDVNGYDNLMAKSRPLEMRHGLLQKKFLYCTSYSSKLKGLRKDNASIEFETPLCVAAASASRRVFVRMLRDGADVFQTDIEECNVIHAIIRACGNTEDAEQMYMEMLRAILNMYDLGTRKKLLFHEDIEGLRPLEAAAKYGTFGLFRMILETPEIYYEVIDEVGMCTYADYDIDDYECGYFRRRELRSPLRFIRMLQSGNLKSFTDNKIHEHPVIEKWINRKLLLALPWMVVWFATRILFLTSQMLFDPKLVSNRTITCTDDPNYMGCDADGGPPIDILRLSADFNFYFSIVILISDMLDLLVYIVERDRWKLHGGIFHPFFNKYVSYTIFFRCTQILLAAVCIIFRIYSDQALPDRVNMFKAGTLPLILMSFIYIIELFPYFGIFATTLQKMAIVMIKFSLMTVLIWIIYVFYFMVAIPGADRKKNGSFATIGNGIYSLFLIDSGNFSFTNPTAFIKFAHITYYYLAAILLLNYLIAIMATLSDEVNAQKHVCSTLRRLDIAILVDDRFGRWVRMLLYILRKKKRQRIQISVKNVQRFKRIKLNVEVDGEQSVML